MKTLVGHLCNHCSGSHSGNRDHDPNIMASAIGSCPEVGGDAILRTTLDLGGKRDVAMLGCKCYFEATGSSLRVYELHPHLKWFLKGDRKGTTFLLTWNTR